MATKTATQIALTAKDTDNRIVGNELNNLITGNAFGIVINGDFGNDTINGGSGDDEIYGDLGKDSINGGAGNDEIYGGDGRDTLTGGDGADCFVFSGSDSLVRKPDTITDFNKSAGDTLNFGDLVLIVGQFNSSDPKTKIPTASLNQAVFDTAKSTLYVNTDNDSAFEFAVVLTGISDMNQIATV